jgi:hypothetical protein
MPPFWIEALSAIYVPLAILSAGAVLLDVVALGRRQPMAVMNAVWPLTMLYWGPLGLVFYAWFGRAGAVRHGKPMWQAVFTGSTHCGAGCALGDLVGDWIAFASGFTIASSALGGMLLLEFVLAYCFGIAFQYFAVAPMRGLGLREGLVAAVTVDTLSLVAYEVGMFAFMVFRAWLYPGLEPTSWSYWLMMQAAMVLGFATTYPVNWWLIRRGTKEAM